jgi:Derlin-2/3
MAGNNPGGPPGGVRGLDDFDFKAFLNDIPPVTRTLCLAMAACTLGSGFKLLPSVLFGLYWPGILAKFQIWRLFFTFLHLGGLGFAFLINMYFLLHYSKQLENGVFFGRTANYCWFITIVMAVTIACSPVIPVFAGGRAILMAVMHLWGRHSPNLTVKLYGIVAVPAKYLSLATVGLELVLSGSIDFTSVIGLVAGHIYYFLDSVYPTMPNGKNLIVVPPAFALFIDQACVALASWTGLGIVVQQAVPPPARRSSGTTATIGSLGRSATGGAQGGSTTDARTRFTMPSLRPGANQWGPGQTLGSS